jgi:preprotein translocase subunit YajC
MSFLSIAASATGAAQQEPSLIASILPLVLIMAIFYLLILRPQQKRYKQHQEMVGAVKKGDKVLTAGGIVGKVTGVNDSDDIVHLQIADSVTVEVSRPTIASVYSNETSSVRKDASAAGKKGKKGEKQSIANDN